MRCPNCGEESRESRVNCLKCGAPLHPQEQEESSFNLRQLYSSHRSTKKCPACGFFNKEYVKHCTRCGLLINEPNKCPRCQAPIGSGDRYCPACGEIVRMEKLAHKSNRPIAALLLGLIPGLLSIWGVGHFFAGNFKKGIIFLIIGLLLSPVAFLFTYAANQDILSMALIVIIGNVIWVVLWLYQSIDAYWEAGGE